MLAIKRQSKTFKALAAGSFAFALGLTSVAAYVNSTLEHQNLVFSKEQTATKSASKTSGEVVLGTQQDGDVTTADPQADAMPWVSTSNSSPVSTPATASVGVSTTTTTNTGAAVATPTPTPVVVTPVEPVPEPSPSLPLCVDISLLDLPIQVGVNCRES